jgi:hypothetical protein
MPQDIIQFQEDMVADLFIGERDSFSFSYDNPHRTIIEIQAEPAEKPVPSEIACIHWVLVVGYDRITAKLPYSGRIFRAAPNVYTTL